MSRYGPAQSADIPIERPGNNNGNNDNNGGRDERRNDRQAPKRDHRDSPSQPPKQSILGDHVQGPPRTEQRRDSRSPPRNEQGHGSRSPPRFGGDQNRSKSPQSRRPLIDGLPQRASPSDNGGRGGREREQRPPLERKNSGSRRDDRSIAEIAHEEQERIDRLQQQSRRNSHPPKGGNLSKYGDAGRGDHFGTPPPPRDAGGRPRGGSFQKPRSRSRSPPGRAMQPIQQRPNDFSRDRNHQSPMMPPHARDLNRGLKNSPQFDHARGNNNTRDSPSFEHQRRGYNVRRDPPPLDLLKRERRGSDGERIERRGRSPPPSPLMTANDRRAPPAPTGAGERRRSRSKTRGRVEERKGSRRDEKESRASNDQNNRNRANDQGKDRSKGRQQPDSPVLPTPQTGKRLRSRSPPSPVLRDNHRAKSNRERSRSPTLRKSVVAAATRSDDDAPTFAEKKRRINDDDDFVLPKPASSAVFDDMDEMMVDYEEDD
ncbi:hypothetical protein Gpo141_00012092 [Globisporangium polare]